MLVHRSLEKLNILHSVVTTGSFDGVHVGHRTIINRLKAISRETGGVSVLVTFFPHPRKILYPQTQGKDLMMINTQQEKIRLLEKAGVDHLVVIPFSLEFSKMTSVDFIRRILVEKLHANAVVVGFNHHFGHNREGDFEYLYELGNYYGFRVEEIPEQDIQNEFVSSTKIRKALIEGNIQRANAYLDHEYFIAGEVHAMEATPESGQGWHEILPGEEEKLVPPPGMYAGSVEDGETRIKMLIRIDETGERKRIGLMPAEPDFRLPAEVELFFHKRVRAADPAIPPDASALAADLDEVRDLIY